MIMNKDVFLVKRYWLEKLTAELLFPCQCPTGWDNAGRRSCNRNLDERSKIQDG